MCRVLTLGSDTRWRGRKIPPATEYYLNRYCSPVTIDGIMYFLTEGKTGTLLCFDLEKERWKDDPIKGPSEVDGVKMWSTISVKLTELNGFVCVVQEEYNDVSRFPHSDDSSTNVWILDDSDKIMWTKVYTIPRAMDTFSYRYRYMPLRVLHGGERLLVQYVSKYRQGSSSFGFYDPHTTSITPVTNYLGGKIVLSNLHLEHLASVKN
jgi:F-box interacting protein